MARTVITLDVYCDTTQHGTPAYRVYVDNDLLTERSWIWPAYEIFIQENLEVDIESGTHQVRIESCGAETVFRPRNLTVDSKTVDSQDLTFST